jgi:hypothetical protein
LISKGRELSCHGILGYGRRGRSGRCLCRKGRDRDIRWSGDDEHGVTDVLNSIIKGEGVDSTCREELSSGLKFLTESLNEGDNKGGLVRWFVELLEFIRTRLSRFSKSVRSSARCIGRYMA